VGERGARTRERIFTEALALFAERGFHDTSVHEIAQAAGISRATLYQYFEDKDQIFVELLDECGGALVRVMRQLGPLGPTVDGFRNLRWWLAEWARVYAQYATMFVQWANVDSPGTAVRPLVAGFVNSYNTRIAKRLRSSGVVGIDPDDAAMVMTDVVHRFNYLRHVSTPTEERTEKVLYNLSVIMQLVLFPATPPAALAPEAGEPKSWASSKVSLASLPRRRTSGAIPAQDARFEGLTARGAATVRQLMKAGAESFAERGYHRSNVDDKRR
jgi:AcrR family transcriptional regulator